MRARFFLRLSFMLIAVTLWTAAQEPVKPKLTPRIITATKQVTLFTGLETQLLQAVQKKDHAALETLVGDDFEIAMPGADPLPGDDWEDSVMAKDFILKSFVIRQMSVADLGDSAVVKFDRLQQATFKGENHSGEFFVVDLWKKAGDSWKLANRYVAQVRALPFAPTLHPKPTGKE